jgi:hypothetical protein
MTKIDDAPGDINSTNGDAGFDLSHLPAPLVIGVTGHRDIREQDRGALAEAIKNVLLELKQKYRSTPLFLLSALAEGADRLAAQVALTEEVRCRLFVPLPMPQVVYEQDFKGDSLNEFRALLNKADGFRELPLIEGNDLESIAQAGPARDLQYESVGKYIVQKSQILIALWDGVDTKSVGGTAAIVRFQKEGLPPSEQCALDPREGFPVYHILTPRDKNPRPEGTPFRRKVLYPDSFESDEVRAAKYYDRMFSRIDDFNRDARRPDSALCHAILKSKRHLLKDLPEEQFSEELRAELTRYAFVDALALRFQSEKVRTEKVLHIAVFAAFFIFLFAHLLNCPPLLLPAILLVAGLVIWRRYFRKRDGDTKFEDYRAMAEGLRVRFFWRLVGLSDSVTDYYLGKQRTELDWIRNGFRGWDVSSEFAVLSSSIDLRRGIELARVHWMMDQRNYFRRSARRDEGRIERIERWGKIMAGIALGLTLSIVTLFYARRWCLNYCFWGDQLCVEELIPFLAEVCLAGAALLHNFGNGMAYREHAKQYRRMEGIFSQAARITEESSDPAVALNCIKTLGKEALSENGDWVLLHRERPLDLPHP